MFSVNVLVYGAHTGLAMRCLNSIVDTLDTAVAGELRIGMNAVSEQTRRFVIDQVMPDCPVRCLVYEATRGMEYGVNALKYPMMRRMLYDPQYPVTACGADRVMWFDDDSYVSSSLGFWPNAHAEFSKHSASRPVMGRLYVPTYNWNEHELAAFAAQPWGSTATPKHRPKFATGGWWVADLEFLAKWDYPFRELQHNGGDTVLGELLYRQGLSPHEYHKGVTINADREGRDARAERRGRTTARPFQNPGPYKYDHHDFSVHTFVKEV